MAAAQESTGTTLSEIFHVEPKLLIEKFRLLPQRCDSEDKDNCVFASPSLLLDDLELREGGWKDLGAKEVLGTLAHDILANKDYCLMQVPAITYFHMGYGRNSKNKNQMAVTESEAKAWMKLFDLTKWRKRLPSVAAGNDGSDAAPTAAADDDDDSDAAATAAAAADDDDDDDEPMDIDFRLAIQEQFEAYELEEDTSDVISYPRDSGLKIPVKSRHLLFFSILLIFYKKKLGKKLANEATIGENKISDVLLFWTLPYLLNFTEQQVKIVKKHHEVASKKCGRPELLVATVKKSTKYIIEAAFQACDVPAGLRRTLMNKYEEYYGESVLEREYELPAVSVKPVEPIILIPLCHQVTNMPVEIEDIGRKWEHIGKFSLMDDFLNIFISNRAIQEDYFYDSMRELELKEKFAVDYGILFPDEATYTEFFGKVENELRQRNLFWRMKCMEKQGRDFLTPHLGLVKNEEKNLSVCFSYFQGKFFLLCQLPKNSKSYIYFETFLVIPESKNSSEKYRYTHVHVFFSFYLINM